MFCIADYTIYQHQIQGSPKKLPNFKIFEKKNFNLQEWLQGQLILQNMPFILGIKNQGGMQE